MVEGNRAKAHSNKAPAEPPAHCQPLCEPRATADGELCRVVLLGASNLARSIAMVIDTARCLLGTPLTVLAAPGHGRSYGISTSLLGRRLPGIVPCALWDALGTAHHGKTLALLTDIGNDVMYDVTIDQVIGWVSTCLDRLAEAQAQVVMTSLPVDNLDTLPNRRYLLMRRFMYPGNRNELSTVRSRARELNERVAELARQRGAMLVPQQPQWYGLDPIHIRWRHWPTAWQTILASWTGRRSLPPPAAWSFRNWVYVRSRRPFERSLFGIQQHQNQPAGRLPDGTTIALY